MKYVGQSITRGDVLGKVTGKAIYPADLEFPKMLYVGVVRSSIPYGRVVDVDYSKAQKLPGVVGIYTWKDVPGENNHGVIFKDLPVLVKEWVKRIGDPIVLIAAESKVILEQAKEIIEIKYEEHRGVFSVEDALKEDAPILGEKNNVLFDIHIKRGDIEKGFREACFIAENNYSTQMVEHGFLQAEAAVARLTENEEMEIYVATQYPHYDREEVARCISFEEERVKIINTTIGAAFGAREDMTLQCHVALAALLTGRPVKMVHSREESILAHGKRHALKMHYKTGVTKEGKLCALQATILGDTGAYASWGINVLRKSAVHAAGPYEVSNVDVKSMAVYTNNTFSGAMRGFGATQVAIAYESQMDILAQKLKLHPLKFRLMNTLKEDSITITGQRLKSSVGAQQCIEKLMEEEGIGQ